MRIYNATKYQLNLPLTETQKITIEPHAPSGNIIPSTKFISLLVSTFSVDQIALIVSGAFELNMCAQMPVTTEYIVQSLDEAINKFAPKQEDPTPVEILEKEEEKPVAEEEAPAVDNDVETAAPIAASENLSNDEVKAEKKKTSKKKK